MDFSRGSSFANRSDSHGTRDPPGRRAVLGAADRRLDWRHVFLRDRRGGPWPVPAHLTHESVTFPGNTGATLRGRYFHLDRGDRRGARILDALGLAQPRGVVVCVHPDRR